MLSKINCFSLLWLLFPRHSWSTTGHHLCTCACRRWKVINLWGSGDELQKLVVRRVKIFFFWPKSNVILLAASTSLHWFLGPSTPDFNDPDKYSSTREYRGGRRLTHNDHNPNCQVSGLRNTLDMWNWLSPWQVTHGYTIRLIPSFPLPQTRFNSKFAKE